MSIGGAIKKAAGQVFGHKDSSGGGTTSTQRAAAAKAERQKNMSAEAKALDDSIEASKLTAAVVENADPNRPQNNTLAVGKPRPGEDLSKQNWMQPAEYEALLESSNKERERKAADVLVKRSRKTEKPSTKGGTLATSPLGVQSAGQSSFSSMLGVV